MKLTIDLPDAYVEAVRWELDRRTYNSDDEQVRRVLRAAIEEAMEKHWWREKGQALWMKGNPADLEAYQRALAPRPLEVIS